MKQKILSIVLLISVSCLFAQLPEPTRQYMFTKWGLKNTGTQPTYDLAISSTVGTGFSHTVDHRGFASNALKLGGTSFWTGAFCPTRQNTSYSDVFDYVISFWIKTTSVNKKIIDCWQNTRSAYQNRRGTQGIK